VGRPLARRHLSRIQAGCHCRPQLAAPPPHRGRGCESTADKCPLPRSCSRPAADPSICLLIAPQRSGASTWLRSCERGGMIPTIYTA
jgi:hypothetical protein